MTIESDILKKLEAVKKEIRESKETKRVVSGEDSKTRNTFARGESSVMFLFDATGSMKRFWEETQAIMSEMVSRITKVGNVKLKCVAYRDYCDGSRIFEQSKWHSEAAPLIDFISGIECNGGGDEPEAVEDALALAYKEKEKVTRVVLIGDAPPHSLDAAKAQAKMLGKQGRPVFAFLVGGDHETGSAFSQIAKVSNGAYGKLSNYKDLLDMMSLAIVHDLGGSSEVEKYLKKYGTSDNVKDYSRSLPSYKK
jgi:hypothetical protein